MAELYAEGTRRLAAPARTAGVALALAAGAAVLGLVLALWHREGAAIFLDVLLSGLATCL